MGALKFLASYSEVRMVLGPPKFWLVTEVKAVLWELFPQTVYLVKLMTKAEEVSFVRHCL